MSRAVRAVAWIVLVTLVAIIIHGTYEQSSLYRLAMYFGGMFLVNRGTREIVKAFRE